MKIFQIKTKQKLPISATEAWKFLSNPKNLAEITPKYMNFKILSGADRSIYAGQIIQYKVTPVFGITLKWVTEITHVKENEYFDAALRRFKRACEKAGILTELRRREFYEKPTQERKRKKAAAVKRHAKRLSRETSKHKRLY